MKKLTVLLSVFTMLLMVSCEENIDININNNNINNKSIQGLWIADGPYNSHRSIELRENNVAIINYSDTIFYRTELHPKHLMFKKGMDVTINKITRFDGQVLEYLTPDNRTIKYLKY